MGENWPTKVMTFTSYCRLLDDVNFFTFVQYGHPTITELSLDLLLKSSWTNWVLSNENSVFW